MPKYLSDHTVYDYRTRTDRPVQLLIESADSVIKHLPEEVLANIAAGLPEKGGSLTVKLLESEESPTGRKRKR